ncbi:MAG: hypothetical protein R3E66_03160 [bacterium]
MKVRLHWVVFITASVALIIWARSFRPIPGREVALLWLLTHAGMGTLLALEKSEKTVRYYHFAGYGALSYISSMIAFGWLGFPASGAGAVGVCMAVVGYFVFSATKLLMWLLKKARDKSTQVD